MHTTNLHKVGGSAMLAVPPALLDLLNLGAGAKVDIGVDNGRLIVAPRIRPSSRRAPGAMRGDRPPDGGDCAWLVSLDPSAGHEQQGTRPVVIVSPAPFNQLAGTPVVLPVTTGDSFACRCGFAVSLNGAGTRTVGVIRCDRPRLLDLAARTGRHLETVSEPIMNEVLARLAAILT